MNSPTLPSLTPPSPMQPPFAFRLLQESDQSALAALDLAAQRALDADFDARPEREREGRLSSSLGAIKFYARTGHSFVAVQGAQDARNAQDAQGEQCVGYVLAQAVWQGDGGIALVRGVVLHPDLGVGSEAQADAYAGLLRAVFKSAFDTATYEVHLCPDPALPLPAELGQLRGRGNYAVRYLGSRDESAPQH